ncbi:MAG: protein-L-isoaspartate(D-aspartate) O-methyltransferase, partial [Bacteroidales bacterium]
RGFWRAPSYQFNQIMKDEKDKMINEHLKGRDIHDERVLEAMQMVNREVFVPRDVKHLAYADSALPIGKGQTISQPYVVAYMAQALDLKKDEVVLEVGTGCGYNAAVFSQLVSYVYSVEIVEYLAEMAKENLEKVNVQNVSVKQGDGFYGWKEKAPFDKIVLTAATPEIPDPLKAQLKIGGRILAPLSNSYQKLMMFEKIAEHEFKTFDLLEVRFVNMTGETEN